MRLVVLGAGASYGCSNYVVAPPPLVHQFFSVGEQHGLVDQDAFAQGYAVLEKELQDAGSGWESVQKVLGMEGIASEHLGALKAFVLQQLGVAPEEYGTKPLNIERLFGLIEAELLGLHGLDSLKRHNRGLSSPDALEQQLYLLICGSLIASTCDVRCSYHNALAESLEAGDVILSFNYDLLIDRALADRGDWWINDGYGLDFHRVGRHSGDSGEWREPLATESKVLLLKPHGSLNWLYCRDPRETQAHVSLRGGTAHPAPSVLYCLEDMHADFREDFPVFEWWGRYEHQGEDGYSFDMHSLIVPPAITKPYQNFEPYIGALWAHALNALLDYADELVFIGYSLRPEDLRSYWLFRKAGAEGQRLCRVTVVDPSEDVAERVRLLFPDHDVEVGAGTLEEYVAEL